MSSCVLQYETIWSTAGVGGSPGPGPWSKWQTSQLCICPSGQRRYTPTLSDSNSDAARPGASSTGGSSSGVCGPCPAGTYYGFTGVCLCSVASHTNCSDMTNCCLHASVWTCFFASSDRDVFQDPGQRRLNNYQRMLDTSL